jgi:hypothetical protein
LPENTRNGIAIDSLERAVGERKGIDRAQDVEAVPDPELVERPRRRRFSAEYKLAILREADAFQAGAVTGTSATGVSECANRGALRFRRQSAPGA